jgi:Mor family transcriptional regulator
MSKKYHYVYQTKNIVTGKTYIGIHSTNNLADGYIGNGIKSQLDIHSKEKECIRGVRARSHMINALLKYGYSSFKVEIMSFYDTREEALEEEKFLVDYKWIKSPENYNTALGGLGGTPKKHLHKYLNIQEDYLSGMFVSELYKKYNVSSKIVAEALSSIDKSEMDSESRFIKKFSHFVPQIRQLCSIHASKDEILSTLNMSSPTLNKLLVHFNINRSSQIYVAINRDGIVEEFTTTTEFAKKYNIPVTGVYDLIGGKAITYKGWAVLKKEDYNPNTFIYPKRPSDRYLGSVLQSPEGVVYTLSTSLEKFRKIHGLTSKGMHNLVTGVCFYQTQGWKLITKI